MSAEAARLLKSVSVAGQNKTAVVVGGTHGIGGGVARLLARKGCARVIVSGRNEERGRKMVEMIRRVAKEEGLSPEVLYVSDVKGMRAHVEDLIAAAPNGIDYLVQTQGGTPMGVHAVMNADGHDESFAIQCISRFAITYLLTKRGGLAPGAIALPICNVGQSLDHLSVDDLSLVGQRKAGQGNLRHVLDQSKRDSSVLDAFTEELNVHFPEYTYLHTWPSLIKTEEGNPWLFPFPISAIFWLMAKTIAPTPDEYAPAPVYLLMHPDGIKQGQTVRHFNPKAKPMKPGKWASNVDNRKALWIKLLEIIGEK
ncbi:hypothetical protein MNV49_000532 [Pseudohyphozyma bogoriensis]|nr:hypothetical protein MNV49_000532 [Pseudohyphozyma bogoriensis]